jgi:DNA processing protein
MNRIFGFTPKTGTALISHLGSASEVFRLSRRSLEEVLGPHSPHIDSICPEAVRKAGLELAALEKDGTTFVGRGEEGYPPLLLECEDAPVGLYIRSMTSPHDLWHQKRSIAVVGTRDISPYGKEWCTRTVSSLAGTSTKPLIVSGLALGTDICAHKTALESGLPTVAVMATGPDAVYPYRHKGFAEELFRTPGCALVTDYPPGTAPLAIHFLRRNRIIAGMSDTTILIESRIKGGGMMTSRLAFSYNRDVFALPGRADDIRSQGCNRLIREKVAEPLTSVGELLESLDFSPPRPSARKDFHALLGQRLGDSHEPAALALMETALKIIGNERGISVEELAEKTGWDYRKSADITCILESEGMISIDLLQRCTLDRQFFR